MGRCTASHILVEGAHTELQPSQTWARKVLMLKSGRQCWIQYGGRMCLICYHPTPPLSKALKTSSSAQ